MSKNYNNSDKYNKYRKNNNTFITQFKSATDIHNYNDFLISLDKKYTNDAKLNDTSNIKTILSSVETFYKEVLNKPNYSGFSTPPSSFIDTSIFNSPITSKKELKYVNINKEINNITDLLNIINEFPDDINTQYNINIHLLHKIRKPLVQLNNMIGMKKLKENILDQIIYYLQNLHYNEGTNKIIENDYMHTVLYGPPGTGKTEIAKIIGNIFSNMGILNKGTFKKVTRTDLIAGYLGQTAIKTKDVIKEAIGGVLFIDEAYALGNEEKRDSFSKECIDTLCEALSDHKDELMVIIAGYEKDLNKCFFSYNQGLNSRFTWRFEMDEYTAEDLYNIFIKKVNDNKWFIKDDIELTHLMKWFNKNKVKFVSFGRDIETLFSKCKIAHSRRVFGLDIKEKRYLTMMDIEKGLDMFEKHGKKTSNTETEYFKNVISNMYV
jgi:SpoVK/Ycf46/Vps4 family AAA+-type ATPase